MRVTITVPEETTADFVIATDRNPGDLPAAILRRFSGSFAAAVSERLGSPRLALAVHHTANSPWDLTGITGPDADDTERLHHATRHIGVRSILPAGDLPLGPHLARAAAKAVAESVCGVLADPVAGQVLPVVPFGRFDEFALADDWLGVALPPYRNSGRCTADEDDIDGCGCVYLTTRGLCRFGLPELQITGVACPHDLAALNVLRTTAQRLLPLGRHPGEHTLPGELLLTSTDFSAFWGNRDPMWDDGPLAVRLTEVTPHRLAVHPPEGFPGTLNEWLWDELPPILHELLSCEPDNVVASHPSG
ncbi:hypothetical protein GWI34_09240 [Actinomadura sp. DSM 109109]|nr:hypothetical protein [Actinomadura lepetitiana]